MTVNILTGQAAEEAADRVTPRSRNAWPGGSGCRGPTAGREVLSWAPRPIRQDRAPWRAPEGQGRELKGWGGELGWGLWGEHAGL